MMTYKLDWVKVPERQKFYIEKSRLLANDGKYILSTDNKDFDDVHSIKVQDGTPVLQRIYHGKSRINPFMNRGTFVILEKDFADRLLKNKNLTIDELETAAASYKSELER